MKKPIIILICQVVFLYALFSASSALADMDDLLRPYESGERDFERMEIGDLIVFWHQRTIEGAVVEKDQIVYQFDSKSEKLLNKNMSWRDDLPQNIDVSIGAVEAESKVEGEPISSTLYIISPESDVYIVDNLPDHPCWVIRALRGDIMQIVVIDAVTGDSLGYGIPPPYTSFSFSGPQYESPCDGVWQGWYQSAEYWFNMLGYDCNGTVWPAKTTIQNHVQSMTTGMFYELAHGGSSYFANGCIGESYYEFTNASDIELWIANYPKMPFAFIGSCGGLCQTGDNTFSYEFRKGSLTNTATVGYCGMAETYCALCWDYSIGWQDALFNYMYQGLTVKAAFDLAQADYPACAGTNNCMRFAGDLNFSGPYFRSGCDYVVGDVNGSDSYNGLDIIYGVNFFKGGPDTMCPPGSCPIPPCDSFFYCGDVNGSCTYNGLDITFGVAHFKDGAPPVPCPYCPPID
jgi:hypothetical protein